MCFLKQNWLAGTLEGRERERENIVARFKEKECTVKRKTERQNENAKERK